MSDAKSSIDSGNFDPLFEASRLRLISFTTNTKTHQRGLVDIAKQLEQNPSIDRKRFDEIVRAQPSSISELIESTPVEQDDLDEWFLWCERKARLNSIRRTFIRKILVWTITAGLGISVLGYLTLVYQTVGIEMEKVVNEYELSSAPTVSALNAGVGLLGSVMISLVALMVIGIGVVRIVAGKEAIGLLQARVPWFGTAYRCQIAVETLLALKRQKGNKSPVARATFFDDKIASFIYQRLINTESSIAATICELNWFPKWATTWLSGYSRPELSNQELLFLVESLSSQAESELRLGIRLSTFALFFVILFAFGISLSFAVSVPSVLLNLLTGL